MQGFVLLKRNIMILNVDNRSNLTLRLLNQNLRFNFKLRCEGTTKNITIQGFMQHAAAWSHCPHEADKHGPKKIFSS